MLSGPFSTFAFQTMADRRHVHSHVCAAAFLVLVLATRSHAAPVKVAATEELPASGTRFLSSSGADAPQNPSPEVEVKWTTIGSAPLVAIHMAHIPGTEDFMFAARPQPVSVQRDYRLGEQAGTFSWRNGTWSRTAVQDNVFCGHTAATREGVLVHVGGSPMINAIDIPDGMDGVRFYYPGNNTFPIVTKMHDKRWYPSLTSLPNQKFFIIGGTDGDQKTSPPSLHYEIWDSRRPAQTPQLFDVEPEHQRFAGQHWYPFTWVLPTSHIFTFSDGRSRFFYQNGTYIKDEFGGYLEAPPVPDDLGFNYPRTATAVMLPFDYENGYSSVEVVIFGGQALAFNCLLEGPDDVTLASRYSYRLNISWDASTVDGQWEYTFGDWVKEDMGIHRVGGDATLLPNGDVIVTSGAQSGCMGDGNLTVASANYPALWPVLYQPEEDEGQRYTILAASTIARTYHSTAALTTDGNMLIAGCDVCRGSVLYSSSSFWDPCKTGKFERRVEVMDNPYNLDVNNRPAIVSVDGEETGIVTAHQGGELTITWDAQVDGEDVSVTSVVLVAPSITTHGFNTHQRVIRLRITDRDDDKKELTVSIPENINLVVPQIYHLFLNNDKTFSKSRWVSVVPQDSGEQK